MEIKGFPDPLIICHKLSYTGLIIKPLFEAYAKHEKDIKENIKTLGDHVQASTFNSLIISVLFLV